MIALDPLFQPAVTAMMTRRNNTNAALADPDTRRTVVPVAAVAMVAIGVGAGGTHAKSREKKSGGCGNHEMFHRNVLRLSGDERKNSKLALLVPERMQTISPTPTHPRVPVETPDRTAWDAVALEMQDFPL
ncbi:MAG TPA: hypothetical protein VE079_24140 [Ensifer sp.]|nr:hypothetical protein [Ensifer sp.]